MSDIIITATGTLGHIRLSRPKALNALTLEMVDSISAALTRFEHDPAIAAVLITGDGERGLCAGGDIRALYDHRGDGARFGMHYFQHEYRMNSQISLFPKPYIAFMDGITMGGGVGISAHGSVRVVTDHTRLAMPETGIGFFPDIGASWLLSRAPKKLGTYLALTGQIIGGADAILAGLADYFIEAATLPALYEKLISLPQNAIFDEIKSTVKSFSLTQPTPLEAHLSEINHYFQFETVEEIFHELEKSDTIFAKETIATLRQRSPTSLKVALQLLRLGEKSETLQTCLQREYAACRQVLKSHDLYEGVRAAIVDKDRRPHWNPVSLAAVTQEIVSSYLQPEASQLF